MDKNFIKDLLYNYFLGFFIGLSIGILIIPLSNSVYNPQAQSLTTYYTPVFKYFVLILKSGAIGGLIFLIIKLIKTYFKKK